METATTEVGVMQRLSEFKKSAFFSCRSAYIVVTEENILYSLKIKIGLNWQEG